MPKGASCRRNLLGSGAILGEVVKAQEILAEKYGVAADVWSVTSYKELRRDGLGGRALEHAAPRREPRKVPYVTSSSADEAGRLRRGNRLHEVLPGDDRPLGAAAALYPLGTDGFGRSESRAALRGFFEVDAEFIVFATLTALLKEKKIDAKVVQLAIKDLGINVDKKNPAVS